jgi:hypothetical protein
MSKKNASKPAALTQPDSNKLETTEQKPLSFADWLKRVPSLEDVNADAITVNIPVTLDSDKWLMIAHVAAMHGETIEETVNCMVDDVALEDDFMNDQMHLWETRNAQDERADERRAEERRLMEEEKAKAQQEPAIDDDNEGDEWKGGAQ